jgi:general stress protein YciG
MTEKKPRGFAAMDPEKRQEIARKGGKAVPAEKRYYANKANASAAGFKGGKSPRRRKVRDASV